MMTTRKLIRIPKTAVFLFVVAVITQEKVVERNIHMKDLDTPTRTLFITKFDYGVGSSYAKFDLK